MRVCSCVCVAVCECMPDVLSVCQDCLGRNIALIQNVLGGVLQSTARKHKPSLERGIVAVQWAQIHKIQLLCAVNMS